MDTKQQTAVMERRFWKRLCALNRFSFFVLAGGVARAADKAGNWIEAHSAQEIVDDAECEVSALKQRIADLEARLEVDARHPYDGIACRDATIAELQAGYDAARLEIESLQKAATDRHALQATGAHPAPCARYCEAQAFHIERRNLHAENERLRTCNKDAQHEIANLQERVQELGQMARDVNSRRVQELEAQLAAVGAGGVEPLRKRCLHQISEPAKAGWRDGCSPDNCGGCGAAQAAPEDGSARFKAQHEFLIWNREQTPPPIESATEYSVFNQAVDFYIAARAAQGSAA